MAKFIDLVENSGTMKDDRTGEDIKWRNFIFGYVDDVADSDKGRNEVSGTKQRYFSIKIKGDKISDFFGFEVFNAEQFNDSFGAEIELIYGRDGLVGVRFKKSR